MTSTVEPLRGERAVWHIEERLPEELRGSLDGFSPMLCHLLYCRGYRTDEEIKAFFAGSPASHDPFLLPDMDAAVARLARAVERGERVAVYGDFDCDGITAAAVLVATLRGCGLEPVAHLPSRIDGHGLHPEALAWLADQGIDLILTADCGVTAIEEVRVARGMGMDVVVTDHHEARADGIRPNCPTVNPTLAESEYPCPYLCGVGIAYKLAQALRQVLPGAPDPDDLLDLVALGTIADVVYLRDENRALVIRGLERLRRTRRPGLLALFQVAGIEPDRVDPTAVAFYVAPRINAANRLATPQLAYDLLTATDPWSATQLARRLSELNTQRQAIVAEEMDRLTSALGPPTAVVEEVRAGRRAPMLLAIGSWAGGVSGLLASKLVEQYGLPAFVGSAGEEGTVAVSARSVPGVHVDEILERCEAALPGGLFLGYGGHSRAGGFRVAASRLDLVRELLEAEMSQAVRPEDVGAVLSVDAEVSIRQLTLEAARLIRSLEPFGMGFAEPLFLVRGAELLRRAPVGNGKHMRFALRQGTAAIDGVCFHAPPGFCDVPPGAHLDALVHIQINEWQGRVKPEVQLRDWRPASA